MPILRAQVRIPATSTVSEDTVTNTWHFTTTGTTSTILDSINSALQLFYETWDTWKSQAMNWPATLIRWYNLEDPEPRVPLEEELLGLTSAPAGSALPQECAVAMSYNAAYVSGTAAARRRGRLFLGPLNQATIGADGRVSTTAQNNFRTAADTLLATSDSASEWAWVVYSPSSGMAFPVVAGWVDNAVDIQRRRGIASTQRLQF